MVIQRVTGPGGEGISNHQSLYRSQEGAWPFSAGILTMEGVRVSFLEWSTIGDREAVTVEVHACVICRSDFPTELNLVQRAVPKIAVTHEPL